MTVEIAESPYILLEDEHLSAYKLELSICCSQQVRPDPRLADLMAHFAEKSGFLASALLKKLPTDHWLQSIAHPSTPRTIQWTLVIITDAEIQALNAEYRQKDTATDVLSFPALEVDELPEGVLAQLNVIELGDIYISLDWAAKHAMPEYEASPLPVISHFNAHLPAIIVYYVAERFLHGTLHLLGQHHATMEDFTLVKSIQDNVLQDVFLSP